MKKNSVIAFLLGLAMCISLAAYEPQFVIPDATIDQNFKNAAAEIKAIDDDLTSVIASTGAMQATLDTAAQLASTQTFTGVNTITPNYAVWVDSKTPGTAGGSSQSSDWNARDLTAEIADTGDIGTLSASSVTLAAGTYYCEWSSPFYGGLAYQTRLRNVTAGSTIQAGQSGYCDNTSLPHCISNGMARFVLTGSTVISLQYIVSGARATNGLGFAAQWGEASIFSILKCTKER